MPHLRHMLETKFQGKIYRNLDVGSLVKKSLAKKEVVRAKNGALVVYTGKYTGRSPNDKFIVDTKNIHNKIDWSTNQAVTCETFDKLYKKLTDYLAKKDGLFIFDGFVGADSQYKLHVRVLSEYAYQTLFSTHLLRRPTHDELKVHTPKLTVIAVPSFQANPKEDSTRSEAFIILNLEKMLVLIGGTKYSGEIKKSIFTVLNIMLPDKKVLPMHCSANIGGEGKTALFFGLSGTGKTTLSADPKRKLIGDDEHGWSESGIFNFEGGCYAKCINLKRENEPQIYKAIRHGSLLENVVLKKGEFDFADGSLTENTRVVYPLEYIENAVLTGVGGHPSYIVFLTADAFGVLPPVAKLNTKQALYHFMSGYTSKLAGTERGITAPKATFSAFFGGPFMALKPIVYTRLLEKYLKKYKTKVYLINTGWSGGAYGVGARISIKDTRAIVDAVLNGSLDSAKYRHDKLFNLKVPIKVPKVDAQILNPQELWSDKKAYVEQAESLAELFINNFKKFKNIPSEIIQAGPKL